MGTFSRGHQPTGSLTSPPGNPPNEGSAGQKPREIRFLGDLQRLEVKPGDRFVLTVSGTLTKEMHDRYQAIWREYIGSGEARSVPLLVLPAGSTIGVIGADDEGSS